MTYFLFGFYNNDKLIKQRVIYAASLEDAYKDADNILRETPAYDDWEYLGIKEDTLNTPPKQH